MIPTNCHRCHALLPPHEDGELIYCSRCGAPQVQLSEELQLQVEQQSADSEPATGEAAPQVAADATRPLWAEAIRYAGLAMAVAAALAAISAVAPLVGGLSFVWMIASPVVVIGMLHRRYPTTKMTVGFGARVGLVTGLGIALVMVAGNALGLIAMRHANAPDYVAAWEAQVKQQPGAMENPALLHYMERVHTVPEFRAGLVLLVLSFGVGMLLLATTAAGAFAGFARSRPRR